VLARWNTLSSRVAAVVVFMAAVVLAVSAQEPDFL
jgi:hypothetical protein